MKTDNKILAESMRILSRDIQTDDGVANAAIAEAADRIEELHHDYKEIQLERDQLQTMVFNLQTAIKYTLDYFDEYKNLAQICYGSKCHQELVFANKTTSDPQQLLTNIKADAIEEFLITAETCRPDIAGNNVAVMVKTNNPHNGVWIHKGQALKHIDNLRKGGE